MRPARVLIIDRNAGSGMVLGNRLNKLGYESEVAYSADDAIRALNSGPTHDLILVNLPGPDESLLMLPEQIKTKTPWGGLIPIVAYTAVSDKELVMRSLRCGYADYVVRPVDMDVFKERVEQLIQKRPAQVCDTYQKPIGEIAVIEMEVTLDLLSERGMRVTSSYRLTPEMVFTMGAPSLKKIFAKAPDVRVASVTTKSPGQYDVLLTFVDLDPTQMRDLRRYLMFSKTAGAA